SDAQDEPLHGPVRSKVSHRRRTCPVPSTTSARIIRCAADSGPDLLAGVPGLEPRTTEGLGLSGPPRANLLDPRIHAVLTVLVYALLRVDTSSFGPRGGV